VWGLNELHKYVPRWDRWFELHDAETLGVSHRNLTEGEVKRHLDWLTAQPAGKPIYMQPQFCDGRFPAATPLPIDDLIAQFGRYFTSTIGYMLGMAIRDGYELDRDVRDRSGVGCRVSVPAPERGVPDRHGAGDGQDGRHGGIVGDLQGGASLRLRETVGGVPRFCNR
jgi:hypothetical protein